MAGELMAQIGGIPRIDHLVAHHAEQDHSGTLLQVLAKYPEARLISTPKARGMLIDLLNIPEKFFVPVKDGETLSLGNKTLKFIHTPWFHWPETMVTYLEEDKVLFSCDFWPMPCGPTPDSCRLSAPMGEAARPWKPSQA